MPSGKALRHVQRWLGSRISEPLKIGWLAEGTLSAEGPVLQPILKAWRKAVRADAHMQQQKLRSKFARRAAQQQQHAAEDAAAVSL